MCTHPLGDYFSLGGVNPGFGEDWPRGCTALWRWVWFSARWRIVAGCPVRPFVRDLQLRQIYITPHCPQCPPVAALKLRLVPVTAARPSGEGNRRYAKWPSLESVAQPSALPGRWHALRAAVCAPLWLSWHLGIGQALRALFWSVAYGQSSCVCPRPPLCFAAARHQPCALVCPSAPRGGSLSPRAFAFWVCYKFSSCLRTKYGGYRPIGLYASVAAGILSSR
jgi:hypothetical protein